jgi:hypothetical protein
MHHTGHSARDLQCPVPESIPPRTQAGVDLFVFWDTVQGIRNAQIPNQFLQGHKQELTCLCFVVDLINNGHDSRAMSQFEKPGYPLTTYVSNISSIRS